MTKPIKLPETMRPQWRALEQALREQLTQQGVPADVQAVVLPPVQTAYLEKAQPIDDPVSAEGAALPADAPLIERLQAAVAASQHYVQHVARGLLQHLLRLELVLATHGEPPGGWPSLPPELMPSAPEGTTALPTPVQQEWSRYCTSVHQTLQGACAPGVIDGALRTIASVWPACLRDMPTVSIQPVKNVGDLMVKHINDWAFEKLLALLLAIARAEVAAYWLRQRDSAPSLDPRPSDRLAKVPHLPPVDRSG